VANGTVGVRNVTADSVYRIGSISKLLSVYLYLIQLGALHIHTPVTQFIPELLIHANASIDDVDVVRPRWNEITISDLASYLAGIPDDRELFCETTYGTTQLIHLQSHTI
jgi:CubicO group peptidase (beta-lactamase class C family)